MKNRCPECHNEIPGWANGVCPTCYKMEKDEKRFGKIRRKPTKNCFKGEKTLKKQTYAFNRLNKDIFGREFRFSEILADLGFTKNEIYSFKEDHLESFYEVFLENFADYIAGLYSDRMFLIINMYYGLTGYSKSTENEISDNLGIPVSDVKQTRKSILSGLSTESGRKDYIHLVQKAYTTII